MAGHKKNIIVKRRVGESFTEAETSKGNRWVCHFVKNSGWCIFRNGGFVRGGFKRRLQADKIMMRMAVHNG